MRASAGDPRKKTLTEIMSRPLPDITPERERELAELEQFFEEFFKNT
ncbi:hypothetical protein [aff. Roholtiella sp. LEGE 12411]|nr:hypothetical protein [aff. Roholtiella sp. LEGE 12411]